MRFFLGLALLPRLVSFAVASFAIDLVSSCEVQAHRVNVTVAFGVNLLRI